MAGYIGNDPAKSSVRIARQTYTTTGSQTDFTFSAGYDPGYIEIYVNGVLFTNLMVAHVMQRYQNGNQKQKHIKNQLLRVKMQ